MLTNKIKYLERKKILFNSHSNTNYTEKNVIMISNYINNFTKNKNFVSYISKYEVGNNLMRNIENKSLFNYFYKKSNKDIVEYIDKNEKDYDMILIKNHEIIENFIDKIYFKKLVFYVDEEHLNSVCLLNNNFNYLISENESIRQKLTSKKICDNKIVVDNVFYFYNFKEIVFEKYTNKIKLVFVGTIRENEKIFEIIDDFTELYKKTKCVGLKIIYGKILFENENLTKKFNDIVKNGVNGIQFLFNLSHKDTCEEIFKSDIAINYSNNKNGYKFKEYNKYNIKIYDKNDFKKIYNICFFNESFDCIYGLYINDEEKSRLNYIIKNYHIKINLFEGIDGKKYLEKEYEEYIDYLEKNNLTNKSHKLSIGALGHLNSFVNIIKDAKKK